MTRMKSLEDDQDQRMKSNNNDDDDDDDANDADSIDGSRSEKADDAAEKEGAFDGDVDRRRNLERRLKNGQAPGRLNGSNNNNNAGGAARDPLPPLKKPPWKLSYRNQ